jgi:hypothetical protein
VSCCCFSGNIAAMDLATREAAAAESFIDIKPDDVDDRDDDDDEDEDDEDDDDDEHDDELEQIDDVDDGLGYSVLFIIADEVFIWCRFS